MNEGAPTPTPSLTVLRAGARLLSFRLSRDELLALDRRHLAFGFVMTWLAGAGRYWDHPDAELLQYLGVGSLVYVLLLASFLWLLIWPLRPEDWRFSRVLTFVTLTAPPALLYAIPVERFMSLPAAQKANFWFLAVVALWRVALLLWFLIRLGRLPAYIAVVATFLPLALIVIALATLNLEHAVFEFMSGMRQPGTANDGAYAVVMLLAFLAFAAGPLLILIYMFAVVGRWSRKSREPTKPREPT
ncbi:MAG: hypothetical protein KC457_25125 [Myxococcales bacterium]|nr:hypothetical protein [Myxococcales bacterium]